jgi:hypothetical protein
MHLWREFNMRSLLRRINLRAAMVLAVVLVLTAGLCSAQDRQSDDSLSAYVNSIAKFTYNMAWPTATYSGWSFESIQNVPGGLNVIIFLDGRSGFDNSDLWLELGFAIRSDGVDKVWVVDDNAILARPFSTMQAIGKLTTDLAKQYQQEQRAQSGGVQPQAYAPGKPSARHFSKLAYHVER